MAAAPEPPRLSARVAHAMPGRVRFRLAQAIDREDAASLADRIAALDGVRRAAVRPGTGSVIVETDGPAEAIEAAIADRGILKILAPAPAVPVGLAAQVGLGRLDKAIAAKTGGSLDHRSALAVMLFGAAVVQAARGQWVGPATTLLVSALSLIEPRRK